MPNSLRAGGCTFAEDPAHNCAVVRPIWSATLDPCVLSVRVVPRLHPQAHVFDRLPLGARRLIGPDAEYLAFNRGGRSEEHTSELQSLMRRTHAVFCLKTKMQSGRDTRH